MRWLPSKMLFQLNMFACSLLFLYLMMHSLGGRDIWGLKLSPLLASHSGNCTPCMLISHPLPPCQQQQKLTKTKTKLEDETKKRAWQLWVLGKTTAAWKIGWDTINSLVWNVVQLSVNLSGCPFVTKSFSHEDTVDSRELEPCITHTSC